MTQELVEGVLDQGATTLGRRTPSYESTGSVSVASEPYEIDHVVAYSPAGDLEDLFCYDFITSTAPELVIGKRPCLVLPRGGGTVGRFVRIGWESRQDVLQALERLHSQAVVPAAIATRRKDAAVVQHRDRAQLLELFEEEPVEPGATHPAEALFGRVAADAASTAWLMGAYKEHPELRRSITLSIGRLGTLPSSTGDSLAELVRMALRDRSLQVREAGVRATETLGVIGRDLLTSYSESVGWLRDYADRVLQRLG